MHLRPALPRGLRATIEHIIPRSMNGPDVLGNVAAACMECNCSRPSDINEMRHLAALFEVASTAFTRCYAEMTWEFGSLPRGSFRVILCDPPWRFSLYSAKGERKSPQAHYDCMPLAEIQALPVLDLAHPEGCALVMWATAPMLTQAIQTMAAWGFTYKTMGVWGKQSSTGNALAFGAGYIFRSAAEPYLVGSRGKPRQLVRNVRNLIMAPVREHSRKPDEMRANIEKLWHGPYLELFAREAAPGWDRWGREMDKFSVPTSMSHD